MSDGGELEKEEREHRRWLAKHGVCEVKVEFVVQDGECGQVTFVHRTLLDKRDLVQFSQWGDYLSEVVFPGMTKDMQSHVKEKIEDGKLWEGAYLVTHPDDMPTSSD
ncbi:hypothetical protein MADRUGA_104 [Mycobacterium phage Madruga]|uniref:Uncharacterized protein n=1 Tax=Mycobacterium phage Madruga TaxID=1675552 RepID=A0A0K1LTA5_9CAUD|nr:hypothetical protein MADRUGA_104 [Mycobacterium phage Madruga]